jgi:glycosyltransferase involved in cell wall biosynthesis
LGAERLDWKFTLALISGYTLHEQMKQEAMPENCRLLWAPPRTVRHWDRARWEQTEMMKWAAQNRVDALIQLNGMLVSGSGVPTLAHYQDPSPYVPQAWEGWKQRVRAFWKRREHARSLRGADYCSFTSEYLRDLLCRYHGIKPKRSGVFYPGLPDTWIERGQKALPEWKSRPMELLSVSTVTAYKRQWLVIRAMPDLVKRPGLENILYRIVGECDAKYAEELRDMAKQLGVGDRVFLEGRQPDARVQELYLRARCFVLMSVCESFGIPAVEAMSFGTPVVTGDCCAIPEICGKGAQRVKVDDEKGLAQAIAKVMLDEQHAEQLRQEGAKQIGKFRWRVMASQMAEALEQIMKNGGVVAP